MAGTTSETATRPRRTAEKPRRILIADDDHLIATGLAKTFESLGFEIVGPAPNGEAALQLAASGQDGLAVDLAVLDIAMPGMNGLETARRLWETHTIPSLIVSAYSEEAYIAEVSASWGIFGYLLKPVGVDNLRVATAVAWRLAVIEAERQGRIAQLEQNLKNRQAVERAKWRLVERFRMTEADAHSALQKAARDTRKPLATLAREVFEADEDSARTLLKL